MARPIAIDLFAGAGGLSLGFEQAGFDVVAAIEIDPVHSAVHKFNFPDCKIIPHSVTDIVGQDIRDSANIPNGQTIDVVMGGAPCQGFSLIGQRALDDPRNFLVKEFLRLVDELQPNYFVFENVKGLTAGKHKKFLTELIEEFKEIGYQILSPWQVLNASDYGVPQSRERLFLIGAKIAITLPTYPESQDNSPTCLDALDDLPDAESFDELYKTDEVITDRWNPPSQYAQLMRCLNPEGWYYGYQRSFDQQLLSSSLRTKHTDISRRRFRETEPGTVEKISRFYKLSKDGISNTLRAGTDSSRGAFTSPRPIHYRYARCVTVREMARLHGFPDWFRLHETKWHGARQIGNSVPPPLARAVASQILQAMEHVPERPGRIVTLGDRRLLSMTVSQAADYWGIENPIAPRDRKSGK